MQALGGVSKTTGVSGVVHKKLFPDMDTMRKDLQEILKESDYLSEKIVPKLLQTFAGKEKVSNGVRIGLMLAFHDVTNGLDETAVMSLQMEWRMCHEKNVTDYLMQYAKS